jgi:hypothetical protein
MTLKNLNHVRGIRIDRINSLFNNWPMGGLNRKEMEKRLIYMLVEITNDDVCEQALFNEMDKRFGKRLKEFKNVNKIEVKL